MCIKIYSYSRIGTNENNMKIRVWIVLWTIIRKARNHCQDIDNCGDEDHCQYHLGIDHCQTGNRCQDREHCQNGNEHVDRSRPVVCPKMHQFNHIMIITCNVNNIYIHNVE